MKNLGNVKLPANTSRRKKPILRLLAIMIVAGCLAVAALLGSLWLEHRNAVTLPQATGPFAVGRTIEAWRDDATDPLTPGPGTKRELLVWIWYPASSAQSSGMMVDYAPASWRAAAERDRGTLISKFLTRDLSKVHAHSIPDADMAPQEALYPIAILRAGASAEVVNYSTLAEDLASHGYIVVGFDAPYRTNDVVFPDGRVIHRAPENNPEICLSMPAAQRSQCTDRVLNAWIADMAFVLDRLEQLNMSGSGSRLAGRLDMGRVGVVGHSFGGAAVAQFCRVDARCRVGIDIDGAPHGSVIQSGLHQPFLFLLSDHSGESDADSRQIEADIQSIYDRLPPETRMRIAIRGANHFLFSDDGALLKSQLVLRTLRGIGVVGIDGRRQLAVTAYCVRTFFDAYLKEDVSVARPTLSSSSYPEIHVLE
jgi:Platelet-activating factor acetylhydrolase, isoform II